MISETTFQEIPFLPSFFFFLRRPFRVFCPLSKSQAPVCLLCIPFLLCVCQGKMPLGIFFIHFQVITKILCCYLKRQVFKRKESMTEGDSFVRCQGFDFLSAPSGGSREGQHFRSPPLEMGNLGPTLNQASWWGACSSDPNTRRSPRLILGFAYLALCHVCNPLCRSVCFVCRFLCLFLQSLIRQRHPCQ